jgi:hypothetical protein
MPMRRIGEADVRVVPERPACADPEHNPPTHMVLEPGTYQHDCPRCGAVTTFNICERARFG